MLFSFVQLTAGSAVCPGCHELESKFAPWVHNPPSSQGTEVYSDDVLASGAYARCKQVVHR